MNIHNKLVSFASCHELQNNLIQPFIVRPTDIYFSLAKITNKCIQFFVCFFLIFTHQPWYQEKHLVLPVGLTES